MEQEVIDDKTMDVLLSSVEKMNVDFDKEEVIDVVIRLIPVVRKLQKKYNLQQSTKFVLLSIVEHKLHYDDEKNKSILQTVDVLYDSLENSKVVKSCCTIQ